MSLHNGAEGRQADDEIRRLFAAYRFKDAQLRALGIAKAQMVDYLCATLSGDGHCVTQRLGPSLRGLVFLTTSPWKSEILGVRLWTMRHVVLAPEANAEEGAVLIRRALTEVSQRADVVICRIDAADRAAASALAANGFAAVGAEQNGLIPTASVTAPAEEGIRLAPLSADTLDAVVEMARGVHGHNHYIYDPRFCRVRVQDLYAQELVRAFHQALPTVEIRVALTHDDAVQGFIVYRHQPQLSTAVGRPLANLDFIGVRRTAQRQGIGGLLNRSALVALRDAGVAAAMVRTMSDNDRALVVLKKLDMRATSVNRVFHRWLDET